MAKNKSLISRWTLLGIFVTSTAILVSGALTVLQLRQNNLQMLELRDSVIEADRSGIDVYERLGELQVYVNTHMNTDLPKLGDEPAIQLKSSFDRAKKAETEKVSLEREAIAREATGHCESTLPNSPLSARAECVSRYIADRPVQEKQVVIDLYRYDFQSPRWTADLAGWLLLVTLSLMVLLAFQVIATIISKLIISSQ